MLLARLDGTWSLCTSLDKADHAERLSLPEALGQLGREKIACTWVWMVDLGLRGVNGEPPGKVDIFGATQGAI